MIKRLEDLFVSQGYHVIRSNLSEFVFFFRMENHFINVIFVVEDKLGLYVNQDQFEHMKSSIRDMFQKDTNKDVHIFSLILSGDTERAKKICGDDRLCWIIDTNTRQLLLFENQISDYYGIRKHIEELLLTCSIESDLEDNSNFYKEDGFTDNDYSFMERKQRYQFINKGIANISKHSYVTYFIILLNIIMFLLCTWKGSIIYNVGALIGERVVNNGEWYRFITAIFLHADSNHIMSNMIMLYVVGDMVERILGHSKFLNVYLLSGFGGCALSVYMQVTMQQYASSVGASGAIFGLIGSLLWLVIVHKGRIETITIWKMLFLIAYSVISGFTASNIDNAGHIGGLITGFLITAMIYRFGKKNGRRSMYEN